jgi:nucleoside-diphosphate-sugar epimerase
MRANDVKEIAFASTGSIYGEATIVPTPEDAPFPVQNTSRIRGLGWKPKKSIREAVELTVDWLDANRWVFAKRH